MNESMGEELRRLEELLLEPETRRSEQRVGELLADDFIEIGSSGRVYDRSEVLAQLRSEPPTARRLLDFRARELAPGVALATYRSIRGGAAEAEAHSLRCSIWARRDGRWRLLFHQGTPLPGGS